MIRLFLVYEWIKLSIRLVLNVDHALVDILVMDLVAGVSEFTYYVNKTMNFLQN